MDEVDRLVYKFIGVFETLDGITLEELAVPENLDDPEGSVDLWVVSDEAPGGGEEISVRGRLSLPSATALELSVQELAELFREELLRSEEFKGAALVACIMEWVTEERGVPSPQDASLN